MDAASGHVVVADGTDHRVLDAVTTVLAEEYQVARSTTECEPAAHTDRETPI